MDKKIKEKLYNELNHILMLMEDREIRQAKLELEKIIQNIFYDQV